MHEVLGALTRWVAPILAFTAEEAWKATPGAKGSSIHLEKFHEVGWPTGWSSEEDSKWEKILQARGKVNEALEEQRKAKKIGKSLEAEIRLEGGGLRQEDSGLMEEVCLVSRLEIAGGAGEIVVQVAPARGIRCERCWKHGEGVGQHSAHPTLCGRCAEVVTAGEKR